MSQGKGAPRTQAGYQPKPPQSYIALITTAILSSPAKRLTLSEINDYLKQRYEFFQGSYQGWKNSVRHNLSFNKCFVKILRDPARPWGKDNYWTVCSLRDYLLSDGTFRRRRRRKPKRKEEEEEEEEERATVELLVGNSDQNKPLKTYFPQAAQNDRALTGSFAESKSERPNFRGSFSIASILSEETRSSERSGRSPKMTSPLPANPEIGPVTSPCCCSRFHVCHGPLRATPSVLPYTSWGAGYHYSRLLQPYCSRRRPDSSHTWNNTCFP